MIPEQKNEIPLKALKVKSRKYLISGIVLIIITGLVTLLLLRNTDKNSSYKYSGPLTLSLIKENNFLKFIKRASQTEKETILIEAAKILRDEIHAITDKKQNDFLLEDFNNVDTIIAFILAIDPENGHTIYFMGEVYRLLNDYDRLCYESADGYCEERTGWISQLLANYYYNKGISEPDFVSFPHLYSSPA